MTAFGFEVQGKQTQPTLTGPDDIRPLVYVVEQPDSPLEVVSADLTGTWFSVANEQHTVRNCASYKVHNRSDRSVLWRDFVLRLSSTSFQQRVLHSVYPIANLAVMGGFWRSQWSSAMQNMPAEMKNVCREFTDEAKNGPSLTLVTLLRLWKCAGKPDTYALK